MDMRVLNTQGRIQAGLFRAINQKPLIMIKDKDVIENAQIAPGTFYKYYQDHTEVLQSIEKSLIDKYRKALSESSKQWLSLKHSASKKDINYLLKNHTEEVLNFFLQYHKEILILTSRNGDPAFTHQLIEMLDPIVRRLIVYYFRIYGQVQRLLRKPGRLNYISYTFSVTFTYSALYFLHHSDTYSKNDMKKYTIDALISSPYDLTQHGF